MVSASDATWNARQSGNLKRDSKSRRAASCRMWALLKRPGGINNLDKERFSTGCHVCGSA
jgi:hypothetical protein